MKNFTAEKVAKSPTIVKPKKKGHENGNHETEGG
jgi:hypothetical protein